jgi:predicted GIY-YIG superfamily endonuclease
MAPCILVSRQIWFSASGSIARRWLTGSRKHCVKRLEWFEAHDEILAAITREKQLKRWNRTWKINLLHKMNPLWLDLFDEICG